LTERLKRGYEKQFPDVSLPVGKTKIRASAGPGSDNRCRVGTLVDAEGVDGFALSAKAPWMVLMPSAVFITAV
jgi:hypothetical protein